LGGTFNPPHIGHLICAQEARWQLQLERIVLMPAGRAPHKEIEHDPGARERMYLCELAASDAEGLDVSPYEVAKEEPAYTVETLEWLSAERPGDELVFLVGADQGALLDQWRAPERILELASVAVAERDGTTREAVRRAAAGIAGGAERVTSFPMPHIGVSSSDIRARVAAGHPYRLLVPRAVADRVEAAGLYRGAA
jgi:nicotinate-nucleotide adenylyltransferase